MTKLMWDQVGEREYETGVDHGVLYLRDNAGNYPDGFSWNGLTTVTESPSGAESNKQYADNQVYLNLVSVEQFGATIEAFTYPDEFAECDGSEVPTPGVSIGQQGRKTFGLCYRTRLGNDVEADDLGYKIHVVYGALAAPSEKAYTTVNDTPEALAFSWEISTTPVDAGSGRKPTASLTIDSTKVDADALASLEDILYGTAGSDPRLPLPAEIVALFAGTVTTVETSAPSYDAGTDMITIPSVAGVNYYIDGALVSGAVGPITEDTVVTAAPQGGYQFSPTSDSDWTINFG